MCINIKLNKFKEIYKTCAEIVDNFYKELTFNNPKKKWLEINGHYEEKTCDEMDTINCRTFISTECAKKYAFISKRSKCEEKDKDIEVCNKMDKDNCGDFFPDKSSKKCIKVGDVLILRYLPVNMQILYQMK